MGSKYEINREFFNAISSVYDKRTSGDWNSPYAVAAIAKPFLGAKTNLLDFGVGTGAVLSALDVSRIQPNIFAVDVASGMIDLCRGKFPGADIRQIKTGCEISTFGWPQFDLIVSSGVFDYIERIDKLLFELKEILNRLGEIIFTYQPIVSNHPKQFDRETNTSWTVDYAGSIGLSIPQNIEAITFRRHAHEVHGFCCEVGLEIVQHESFVAHYDHGPGKALIPRISNIVRARHCSP